MANDEISSSDSRKSAEPAKLDAMDRKLLRKLQAEPHLTMAELAERIGLSHTPCWRRVKRLEDAGIILRRPLILDPVALGYPVNVLAFIKIKNHESKVLEAFEHEVLAHPEIVACYTMSGESDYVLRVMARSIEDYETYLKRILLHLPGVGSINSSFAMKQIKQTTDVPI
ncbi:Lrp/AsnC family transcriptional regulator [Sphingomonas sp. MG17]|uniref:Lrp/AsnC family transcriptional regulator n=1 Tax=Sphingomonas tagetis TaxID=2949092 RepID=A0A9X2HKT8_9SPHN|nr:Lrp/AsnC family transcriptional regulator [Sphingomonas tagetis]MCP3732743.1 Lrp/AsnC family transcriptional regulator [Sphingomonas tagetis]